MGNADRRFMVPIKYRYLIDESYLCSNKCCELLKKKPFRIYHRKTGLYPILGTMAAESQIRTIQYLKHGECNSFDFKYSRAHSAPLSIWLEQDIKDYIEQRKLKICSLYSKGFERTGCMFCGFGVQFDQDVRLNKLYELHPKWYEMCMNYVNNGVTYREALRKLLAVNNLRLPDEQ